MSEAFPVYFVNSGNTEPGEPAEYYLIVIVSTLLCISCRIELVDLADCHITVRIRRFRNYIFSITEVQFGDLSVQFISVSSSRFQPDGYDKEVISYTKRLFACVISIT